MKENPDEYKGVIYYPCCPKEKAIAYKSSHGRSSVKCPNCGSFVLLDYDDMVATKVRAVKGVVAKFKFKNDTD